MTQDQHLGEGWEEGGTGEGMRWEGTREGGEGWVRRG